MVVVTRARHRKSRLPRLTESARAGALPTRLVVEIPAAYADWGWSDAARKLENALPSYRPASRSKPGATGASSAPNVDVDRKLTIWGCEAKSHNAKPRINKHSRPQSIRSWVSVGFGYRTPSQVVANEARSACVESVWTSSSPALGDPVFPRRMSARWIAESTPTK